MDYKNTLGRLVGTLNHLMIRNLDKILAERNVPITAEQFKLMTLLWERDGVSQQEVALKLGRNRAATGRMLEVLEKKNIIARTGHPSDKRLNLVFVTKLGKKIEKDAIEAARVVINKSEAKLTTEEIETIKKLLQKVLSALK
jgi:DNA-binding MarR family transcriptional regulator